MNTIKAGDIVRVIKAKAITSRLQALIGKDVRVADVRGNYLLIDGMHGGPIYYTRFEKVAGADEIKIGKYIISLERGGDLLPAEKPRTYSSDAQALKVAEQMAAKHGGKFLIFKAIGEYEMPVAKPTFRSL
jgi:hypothetical protein